MKDLIRFGYQFRNKEEIILRDFLALERTRLANERTFISYIRTSLFFLTGGLTLFQLEGVQHLHWLGYTAMAVSVVLLVTGIVRFLRLSAKLQSYYKQINSDK